jgi:sugar/nucleoside kinase (ribokinase family)
MRQGRCSAAPTSTTSQRLLPTLATHTVVVHDRSGATAITATDVATVRARAVHVIDPIGAGDAFVRRLCICHAGGPATARLPDTR